MRILDLFSGTGSIAKVAREMGHEVFTSDIDPSFETDYCVDVLAFDPSRLPWRPDLLWASPPCESFSVLTIGRNWNYDLTPKGPRAELGLALVKRTLDLIAEIGPDHFVIENPRGMLRKMPLMNGLTRQTVTYCQYGEKRMKPTDLWSCEPLNLSPPCNYGAPCHERSPRGSRNTGTKSLRTRAERAVVPPALCRAVIERFL